jgi:cytochrome c biogenesis protein
MHYHPQVFGVMDRMVLGDWFAAMGNRNPGLTWWLSAAGVFLAFLGVNTLCCFIDWLRNLQARWRKTGEYLIHLGFVLVLAAYFWGSLSGFRSEGNRLLVGEVLSLQDMPGHALRLEAFEPVFSESGRPVDMRSTVTLLKEGVPLKRQVVKTNTPLTYRDLVVVPGSFGQVAEGFQFFLSGGGTVSLTPGTGIPLDGGGILRVVNFFPNAGKRSDRTAVSRGENPGPPCSRMTGVPAPAPVTRYQSVPPVTARRALSVRIALAADESRARSPQPAIVSRTISEVQWLLRMRPLRG